MFIERVLLSLSGAAALRRDAGRLAQIQQALQQYNTTMRDKLQGLPSGTIVPVSRESPFLIRGTDGKLVTTGVNPTLAQLGVEALELGDSAVTGDTPEIVYGPLSALDQFGDVRAKLKNREPVRVVVHSMATYAVEGIPQATLDEIAKSLGPNVSIVQLFSGATSFLGIDYTGNIGANALLLEYAVREKCQVVILTGGFGTRLALMDKNKALLDIGPHENLLSVNIVFGKALLESYHPQAQSNRYVMLGCDGKFNFTGRTPYVGTRTLSSIPPDELKDVYIMSSPLPRKLLEKGFISRAELLAAVPEAKKYEALLFDAALSDENRWVLKPNAPKLVDGIRDLAPHKKAALKKLLAAREDPTFRFGIMILDRYGDPLASSLDLVTSGEKIGIVATVAKAKEKLRELSRNPDTEEFSIYLNWYGFSATSEWIKEYGELLDTVIDPQTGATLRTAGNVDTYGLLLAALGIFNNPGLQDPQGSLRNLLSKEILRLMPENQIDVNFINRLQRLLFRPDGTCRLGIISFGADATTEDLGALPDVMLAEQNLVEGMSPLSVLYDRFLKARELLERQQKLTDQQKAEIDAVMKEVQAAREIQREVALRQCNFDRDALLKNVRVVPTDDKSMLPILGAPIDEYQLSAEATLIAEADGWEDRLARIVRKRSETLPIYHDPATKRPLFRYDPEGIKTLRLEDVVLAPGVIIGRHVGIRGEGHVIGHPDGTKTTYIADGGVIIRSNIRGSFTHPSDSLHHYLDTIELVPLLEQLSQYGRGTNYALELPDGNVLSLTFEGTLEEKNVRSRLSDILVALQQKEGRQLLDQERIEEIFGVVDNSRILTIDRQKRVRLYGPAETSGPGSHESLERLLNGTFQQDDPSQVFTFRVALRKKPLPGYIVYRCDDDGSTHSVTAPTLFMTIPLVASREAVRVEMPFTFSPDTQPIPLEGRKLPVKSIEAQAGVSLHKEFEVLSDRELAAKAPAVTQEVAKEIALLPAKAKLSSGLTPFTLDTAGIEGAITEAVAAHPSSDQDVIADAIVNKLIEQTPALLKHYIAQIVPGIAPAAMDEAFRLASDFNNFCRRLGLVLTEGIEAERRNAIRRQRGAIKSLMEAFAPAELIGNPFKGLNAEGMVSFRDMVIAILTRFRKQEVKTAPQAPSEFMATVDLSRAELDRITTK